MDDPGDPVERSIAKLIPYEERESTSIGIFSVFCPVCQEPTDPHSRTGRCLFCETRLIDENGKIIFPRLDAASKQEAAQKAPIKTYAERRQERQEYQERIVEALSDGPLSRSGIARKTGLSYSRIYFLCRDLRQAGRIRMVGNKRGAVYHLVESSAPSNV